MSDMPERVWVGGDPEGFDCDQWWSSSPTEDTEYIRADLYERLQADNQRLRRLLVPLGQVIDEHYRADR